MSCHEVLKEKGYRLTSQRAAVLDVLHGSDSHLTAEDIYGRVRASYPQVNRSTVYRTLELLKELELVDETDFSGDRLYYHHEEKGHHHHLVCRACGRVMDTGEEILGPLKEHLVREYGFLPDMRHLAIFGYCGGCRGNTGEGMAPGGLPLANGQVVGGRPRTR
ncbi:MAG: Fur family transcriptional regulator [Chloroflexota bacterium]